MRRLHLTRAARVRILTVLLCLLAAAGLALGRRALVRQLSSQLAWQRWSGGESGFSQLGVYYEAGAGPDETTLMQLRQDVDAALAAESLAPASENARLWFDAFSAQLTVTLRTDSGTLTARAIATGGDFFQFHPLAMRSGWYYSPRDVMQDQVILDPDAAWALFGGYDLTGMTLTVNGLTCRVAGVAEKPDGAEGRAYGDTPTVWLSWDLLKQLTTAPNASCYEAVLPQPVKDFAKNTLTNALKLETADGDRLTQSPKRFSYWQSLRTLAGLSGQLSKNAPLQYPYWENAARVTQTWCGLLAALVLLLLLWPLIWLALLIIRNVRRLKRRIALEIQRRKS